ncbi:MAG: D-alanyl-D-alanine carboxypeptidase family protein [Bacillota bacterium]|jgi:D-alanyl-D-alanine carboxypeptidase (penicillin-binding protein 5/6)
MNPGKKIITLLLTVLLLLSLAPGGAPAALPGENGVQTATADTGGPETTGKSAVIMDALSGKLLYAKEPDQRLPMASVTKLMTLLLAVEAVEQGKVSLTDRVVTSENAWSMGGSQIYLEPGEEMSMEEMLIAVAVGSANDASVAVGEHITGTEEAFVDMMNQRAAELGCKNTNFVNPTGLPAENHYTSAKDMAIILKKCLDYPLFMSISSIYEYDLRGGDFKLWNTNKLLKWYKGVDAGKTGWTNEASYCLASSGERDGMRLIVVVLGTTEPRSHFRESIKLYNYGFARFTAVKLAKEGEAVKTVKVFKGVAEQVDAVTTAPVAVVVPKGEDKDYTGAVAVPDEITAPVTKGQVLGDYLVTRDGKEMLKVPVVASAGVEKASIFQQMYRVMHKLYTFE